MKRLYRSSEDRMIAGVCGGMGEVYGIDPTLLRLGLVFLGLAPRQATADSFPLSGHRGLGVAPASPPGPVEHLAARPASPHAYHDVR